MGQCKDAMSEVLNNNQSTQPIGGSAEQFLRWGIQAVVFLILLTPLVVLNASSFPTVYPKAIYFRVLAEILFLFYILLLLKNSRYLPRLSPIFLAVIVFLEILIFSTWTGMNPERSFWGTIERGEGLILFLHLFLFFVVLVGVFRQKAEWMTLLRFVVLTSIPLGIETIARKFANMGIFYDDPTQPVFRVSATFGNPIFYAVYLGFIIYLAIFLGKHYYEKRNEVKEKTSTPAKTVVGLISNIVRKKSWLIFFGIAAFNSFLLLLTESRGVIIGMLVSAALLAGAWLFSRRSSKAHEQQRKALLVSVFLLLLFFVMILFLFELEYIQENIFLEKYNNLWGKIAGAGDSRLRVWQLSLEAWQGAFFFGHGLDSFSFIYDKYYQPDMLSVIPETLFFDRAHNKILDLGVFSGLLGIVSYLAVFGAAVFVVWKYWRWRFSRWSSFLFLGLLLSYFLQNLVGIDTITTYVLFFFLLAFLDANFRAPPSSSAEERVSPIRVAPPLKFLIAAGAVGVTLFTVWFGNIHPYQANVQLVIAHNSFGGGQPEKGIVAVRKALEDGPEFLRPELSYYLVENIFYARRLPQYANATTQQMFVQELQRTAIVLEDQLEDTEEVLHTRAYLLLMRAYISLYITTKDPAYLSDVDRIFIKAIKLNPDVPIVYRLAAKAQLLNGNRETGFILYAKAFEIDKDLVKFHEWMGESFIDLGEHENGADMFWQSFRISDFYTEKGFKLQDVWTVADIYESVGNYKKMADLYEEVIVNYPDRKPHPQLFASLSKVYSILGDTEKARETTARMLVVYPELRLQAEEFLSSLEEKP